MPKPMNIFRFMLNSLKTIVTFILLCISARTCHHQACVSNYLFHCACLAIFWRDSSQWARTSSFTTFLDHAQRSTTVGRTTLDEWWARRRDLCLPSHTTLTTDKRPCPRWDSNLQSQQARGRRTTTLTARPLPYTLQNHWLLFVKLKLNDNSRVKCSQTKIKRAEMWVCVSSGAFSCVESVLLLNPVDWLYIHYQLDAPNIIYS